MKKTIKVIGAVLFTSVILTSCGGGSIESDAKKVAELQCKAQQLMQKATSGDMSVMEESTKIATEAASLSKEMEGKYTSDSDKQKFGEALLKEMGNCK
jgi:predicted small secreted protein